jgi:alcohol dehydrogenase (cytochrome c)
MLAIAPTTGSAVKASPTWRRASWRAELYAQKLKGGLPELSWRELWQMTGRAGGFGLAAISRSGMSVDGSLQNPYITEEDYRTGKRIYRQLCAECHGNDGNGWHGPALNRAGLKHGDSDLAIYKVIRDGIPNTAMAPVSMSAADRWRLVAYLRTLQIRGQDPGNEGEPTSSLIGGVTELPSGGTALDSWLTYSGSLDGWRYATPTEVDQTNVSRLRLLWSHQFDNEEPIESTPLVTNGVIFVTEPPSSVVAIHVNSGDLIWRHDHAVASDLPVCCRRVNRGVALYQDTLYLPTLDGYLLALNANNGRVRWQIPVVNPAEGYTLTGAPLIVNNQVLVGVAGGEFGIRGFLVAYDVVTGNEKWRFNTIPAPGEPGHDTWANEAWRTGGGATWITGSYDRAANLVFWGVGNPAPDFAGEARPGDNLFTNSVIALRADTGKLVWHFQFTPHDVHDWDSNQVPILADLPIDGRIHRVVCWANRNGFYYVLDRETGEFLKGVPFVAQNWARGLDQSGRPILAEGSQVSTTGRLTRPGVGGGTNWQNAAFDPERQLVFVHATEGASVFTKSERPTRGQRGLYVASAGSSAEPATPVVRALDAATGAKKWETFSPPIKDSRYSYSGLLATRSGLVFGASGGRVFAVDSDTGKELWRVSLGGDTRSPPISFTINGRQVILIAAGRSLFLFGL